MKINFHTTYCAVWQAGLPYCMCVRLKENIGKEPCSVSPLSSFFKCLTKRDIRHSADIKNLLAICMGTKVIALHILDVKGFMGKLLGGRTFDRFLLSEAIITTYNTFIIDGHIKKEFYSTEELEDSEPAKQVYSYWHTLKPFCFELIKGKKTPLNFKYVFLLAPGNVIRLLQQAQIPISADDINGLYLNIKYDGTTLSCITGTSLKVFTLDKTLDSAWDNMVKKFLMQQEIIFEEQ